MNCLEKKIRNVAIVAHVDAGKTTITEQLLFHCGAIGAAGSVDNGTCASDSLSVERQRGISVRLANTAFVYNGVRINLIDTPGHVDFCAEVERSISALDCAVLVLSAVEGVQAHTETIFKVLRSRNIPVLFFINKIDRIGADVAGVISEIKRELCDGIVVLQEIKEQETANAAIALSWSDEALDFSNPNPFLAQLIETIAERDDGLLEKYLDGRQLTFNELNQALTVGTNKGVFYPVLFGVAKNAVGIEPLLDAIVDYLPAPVGDVNKPLCGIVFKVEYDNKLGKIASVRLFDGQIIPRDLIVNSTKGVEEKANLLKKVYTTKYEDIKCIQAGDIGAVCGLSNAQVGDVLGVADKIVKLTEIIAPLLTVQVLPKNENDYSKLAFALTQLADEDPTLDLQWLKEQREIHIKITGWIQIEVLEAILKERFNIDAIFEDPTVIYKETPSKPGHGYERYWMPKPCWAIIKFLIEPGPLGSGVVYKSRVGVNHVAAKYQNEVERTIPIALQQGIKGWEVTDLEITLIEGEDHNIHSNPGDFIIATPMAIMNGLTETDTTLLEPILEFKITASEDLLGAITSDLTKMRATINNPTFENGKLKLEGKIPAATSLDYPIKLASRSGGKAKMATSLSGWEPCELKHGKITKYRGISPLDRSKYILNARGAFSK